MFVTYLGKYRIWLINTIFFILKRKWSSLIEIGEILKTTREASGLTIEEVSNDLEISILILEQIENGNIGAFKDIFELKDDIHDYAKYLGLDSEEIIDEFNEFMFEKTSKIPMEEVKKAVKEKEEEQKEDRIASPYTKAVPRTKNTQFILTLIGILVLVLIAIWWSVSQIT